MSLDTSLETVPDNSLSERYRLMTAVLNGTTDSVFVKDRCGRYRIINQAGARYIGKPVAEILGRDDTHVFPPDVARRIMAHDGEVMRSGTCRTFEVVLPVGGARRVFQSTKAPYRDEFGEITGLIGISRDITEPKATEEALRAVNEKLRAIVGASPAAIIALNRDGRVEMWNPAAARVFGWTADEVLGRPLPNIPLDAQPEFAGLFARALAGEPVAGVEARRVRKDGTELEVAIYAQALRDASGAATGTMGVVLDVTDRRRAERALRASEERLARVVESAMDAIVAVDDGGAIRLFNAAAEDVFRCRAADALGQPFERFASRPLREMLVKCRRAFDAKQVHKRYVWVPGGLAAVRSDGGAFPIEATISRVDTAEDKLLTIILRDVNERAAAEAQLTRLRLENLYLSEQMRTTLGVGEIVGRTAAMHAVFDAVEQVAHTDATVLLTGETGTGKGLVARAIHNRSSRADRLLIEVNCAALPSGLVESELFGHEKGAFTGATSRHQGRFELADGGTIFLDEVGDLPLELQAKLLRVLQEGEFERVGGTETLKVRVRVIAATNRDLERAVDEQRFRADLYYRLNVFPIRVPPLRERKADIPLLARHFALQAARKMGKRINGIPPRALDALCEYDWPGNVRELQNVIERAVIISPGETLTLGAWPPPAPQRATNGTGTGLPTLAALERDHILKALDSTNWRVSGARGAARVLGLKPTTLESRMKRLGIHRRAPAE